MDSPARIHEFSILQNVARQWSPATKYSVVLR